MRHGRGSAANRHLRPPGAVFVVEVEPLPAVVNPQRGSLLAVFALIALFAWALLEIIPPYKPPYR